jgi:UDP-glucuronate decarboxylase
MNLRHALTNEVATSRLTQRETNPGYRRHRFLGSHLCDRLLAEGNDVLCVDNFFTGIKSKVVHLRAHPRLELICHDVTFPLYVEVDEIYNLACLASPIHYQHDPVQTTKTSVHGAINMVGLAKRAKAKILQTSTSEVYGAPSCTRKPRPRVNPVGWRLCYHGVARKLCFSTVGASIDCASVRIFNT